MRNVIEEGLQIQFDSKSVPLFLFCKTVDYWHTEQSMNYLNREKRQFLHEEISAARREQWPSTFFRDVKRQLWCGDKGAAPVDGDRVKTRTDNLSAVAERSVATFFFCGLVFLSGA